MPDEIRFDIGFVGGGSAGGTARAEEWEALERALEAATAGLVRVKIEGGALYVRPAQVAWARRYDREGRIGF